MFLEENIGEGNNFITLDLALFLEYDFKNIGSKNKN